MMLKKFFPFCLVIYFGILIFHSQLWAAQLWSENWEGNWADNWYAETGIWEVGAPTSGPGSAYSPENCAATVLDGNYPARSSSRLIQINPFNVPAAEQNPRLRFQHWYNLGAESSCQVQIKVDGGSWEAISPSYSGTSGGVWTRPYIDLTPYAGQSVQIAFYFSSGFYTGIGWYIDDIEVIYGEVVFNKFEDWESGLGDWNPETGIWEVGAPTSGPGSAYSPENCAATILSGNYPARTNSKLISPHFVVADANENPHLRFQHWYNLGAESSCQVQIKVDGGSWEAISPSYSGTSGGVWTRPYIDLTPYAGQSVQIAFYFSSGFYTGIGWYIDDIEIFPNEPEPCSAQFKITPPSGYYMSTQDFDFGLLIKPSDGCSVVGMTAILNGKDVTAPLQGCLIPGSLTVGGETQRCPAISDYLHSGLYTFSVTLELDGGATKTDTVKWNIISNTEP